MGRAQKLERIIDSALDKIDEILALPLDPRSEEAWRLISAQTNAAIAALNIGVKVDDNHFRQRNGDALVQILEKITAAEAAKTVN